MGQFVVGPPGKFDISIARRGDQQDLFGFRVDNRQNIDIGTTAVDIDFTVTIISGKINNERLLSDFDIFALPSVPGKRRQALLSGSMMLGSTSTSP